jgi:hypothetical protein
VRIERAFIHTFDLGFVSPAAAAFTIYDRFGGMICL